MSRQGAAIERLIRRELHAVDHASAIHIVDASAGIGTQALPLARQGFRVTARDISPASIARLEREAAARDGVQYRLHQEWAWIDSLHYDATMVIEQRSAGDWLEVVRSSMRYHAISIDRLMAIMQEAGFVDVARDDAALYQPVLIGRRSR